MCDLILVYFQQHFITRRRVTASLHSHFNESWQFNTLLINIVVVAGERALDGQIAYMSFVCNYFNIGSKLQKLRQKVNCKIFYLVLSEMCSSIEMVANF